MLFHIKHMFDVSNKLILQFLAFPIPSLPLLFLQHFLSFFFYLLFSSSRFFILMLLFLSFVILLLHIISHFTVTCSFNLSFPFFDSSSPYHSSLPFNLLIPPPPLPHIKFDITPFAPLSPIHFIYCPKQKRYYSLSFFLRCFFGISVVDLLFFLGALIWVDTCF